MLKKERAILRLLQSRIFQPLSYVVCLTCVYLVSMSTYTVGYDSKYNFLLPIELLFYQVLNPSDNK
jgi:hypothetical protein